MKWRTQKAKNSMISNQIAPRISMIVGIENDGSLYLSLLQANNDSKTMEIFFHSLVRKLDQERPNWRSNTILLLDNAPYHTSGPAYDMMAKLKLPVLFTGAYSYDASPVELFFAHFKKGQWNPTRIKTGKT